MSAPSPTATRNSARRLRRWPAASASSAVRPLPAPSRSAVGAVEVEVGEERDREVRRPRQGWNRDAVRRRRQSRRRSSGGHRADGVLARRDHRRRPRHRHRRQPRLRSQVTTPSPAACTGCRSTSTRPPRVSTTSSPRRNDFVSPWRAISRGLPGAPTRHRPVTDCPRLRSRRVDATQQPRISPS